MYKILIVEDDTTIANGLKNHLEKWDYEVECITDFKNIMDSFAKNEPQLVLLDIVLPFLMDFTGVRKSERFQKFQLFSSHRRMII